MIFPLELKWTWLFKKLNIFPTELLLQTLSRAASLHWRFCVLAYLACRLGICWTVFKLYKYISTQTHGVLMLTFLFLVVGVRCSADPVWAQFRQRDVSWSEDAAVGVSAEPETGISNMVTGFKNKVWTQICSQASWLPFIACRWFILELLIPRYFTFSNFHCSYFN